jgi:branched-chain amino acid transport system substrate-binding protein
VPSHVTRNALVLGTAGLLVVGMVGCTQSKPAATTNLKIVEQIPIDDSGNKIQPPDTAAAANPAGDGKATCKDVAIAMAGALTGSNSALGINIINGVQMAVDVHNAANPDCQVQLKKFDTEGDRQKATQVAPQIVDDKTIVGLVGPAFSGETDATGHIFAENGLLAATASATNVTLSEKGWQTFFRGLGNDGAQGKAVANYLKNTLKYQKICVVDDATEYGLGLAKVVRETLGPLATCSAQVKEKQREFSAVVNQIKGAAPDALFYAGYYAEAAPFVQQLRDGGVTATFVSADGTKDPEFVKQAGQASKDSILSCPCSPAPAKFTEDYKNKFKQDPGTYSTEGYDLATILLKGIDSGAVTRQQLLEYVRAYNGPGVARQYQWTSNGELTNTLIWIYKVQ